MDSISETTKGTDREDLASPIKNNIFAIPVKTVSPLGQAPVASPVREKQQFKISKITTVRPVVLNLPLFDYSNQKTNNNGNHTKVESKRPKSLKSTFKTIIGRNSPQRSSACRFVSVMDPVRRLPRSSELIRNEKELSASKENMSSSTDSLNEGSQKKARLKIPKPAKLISSKSKSDEKKKKEDSNNNSKKSGDSLERPSSRSRKSMGRRQSSKDIGLPSVDQIISSAGLTRQDSKDLGRASPVESPTREKAGSLRLQGRSKQVSFEEGTREKPRSGSGVSSPSYESPPVKMRPRRNTERIMRDYRLSIVDVQALKCLMEKVDMFDDNVRDTVLPLLKEGTVAADASIEAEKLSDKVVKDAEKENLKEKLFLSRKELDSYISFCKKMEREKRQTISEKEDLVTKTQWLDKRMNLIESENKALKIERADLLNQVYRLRCPTNVPIAERGRLNTKSGKESEESQSEVEISKQRLLYEADAFSQERSKMIKERQRLDEEVRKVQIRCVSLLAQLQHSEKTVDDLQKENEDLKAKFDTSTSSLMNEQKILEKIKGVEEIIEKSQGQTEPDLGRRMSKLLTNVKDSAADKFKLNQETSGLKRKVDETVRDNRLLTEEKLNLEYELMALRDGMKSDQKAKNECEVKLAEVDTKLHHLQAELRHSNEQVVSYEKEREGLVARIDEMNAKIGEMQRNEVEIESDRVSFQKFIEMLSLEMEEKLGEEIVSTDTEATSLQDKADQLGKQISAHLTPNRKIQENYQDLKEELDDIKQENKALKYAMSCRMEIQNMRATQQTCDCSSEKELMKRELEETTSLIDHLEDEVKRLHDDKQSLLLSFLNLQAASRSREPSRTGTDDGSGSEAEDSGDVSDTEEEDSDEDGVRNESDITDEEEDEVSEEDKLEEDRYSSDASGHAKKSLRKAVSLPVEALRLKAKDTFKASTPDEIIANLESKVEEMKKTKEVMEEERLGLLDTLCKQDKQIEELKTEIEKLEDELDEAQETETSISTNESCPNCSKASNEIRQYLSIMESLTEDKLRLEKTLTDVKRDKEQLLADIESINKEKFFVQSEFENLKTEMEETAKKFQKEMEYLLQNMEYIEQENKTLENHLQNVRQNKLDLLGDLKDAEKDRLGLVKSLQSMGVEKSHPERRRQSEDQDDSAFADKVSDDPAKPIIVEDYIEEKDDVYNYAQIAPKHNCTKVRRSFSTGDKHSFIQEDYAQQAIDDLQNEVSELRVIIDRCKRDNRDLRKAVDSTEALLDLEQASVRELERQKLLARDEIRCLKEEVKYLKAVKFGARPNVDNRKHYLESVEDESNIEPQSTRHPSLTDLSGRKLSDETRPRRKLSAPSLTVAQAKTLCFQISFNGMTLMEKTDFGET